MATRRQARTDDRVRTPRLGLLTVGETARILGVSPSTLRLWENVGLISPARSNGRYRLYGRELLEVLKRIKYLRDVKRLNLPGIRQELNGRGHTPPKSAKRQPRTDDGDSARRLGPKLRQLRRRHGIGVVEAARRAKISPGFLSAIELSRANPSVATLQRLAATYGTTVLEFFDMPKHARAAGPPARAAGDSARLRHPHRRCCRSAPAQLESHALDDSAGHRQRRRLLPPGRGVHLHAAGHARALARRAGVSHAAARATASGSRARSGIAGSIRRTSRRVLLWINTPPTF